MKPLFVAAVVLLVQVASAEAQFVDPDQYKIRCRLCGVMAAAPTPAPVVVNIPSSDGWIKTLAVLLLGSTLTLWIQRHLKVLEQRFVFLREAMVLGTRCDKAALKFLTASIHHARWEGKFPRDLLKDMGAASDDAVAEAVQKFLAPGAQEAARQRTIMEEARQELNAAFFEAVNLLVPMPVLFSIKVQNQYMTAINCYATERHRFSPTALRDSVRQFHEEWKKFNALGARACWTRYRRTKVGMLVLSKEDQEMLERVLRGADDAGKKEGEK